MARTLLADPRHFSRSYSAAAIDPLITARAPRSVPRFRELNLYRQYFDPVTAAAKTVEVRVKCTHLADLAAEDVIRFRVKGANEPFEEL